MLNGTGGLDDFEDEHPSIEELEEGAPRCTDSANADAFVLAHGHGFRYVAEWGSWIAWNGQRWVSRGAGGRVVNAAMLTARAEYVAVKAVMARLEEDKRVALIEGNKKDLVEELDARIKWMKKLLLWHEQSQNASRLNACVQLAATRQTIFLEELDASPWLLNVRNGTIDLRSAELRPHDRDDFITQLIEIDWDDAATCPTWDAFLARAMGGDTQLVLYLARTVGYSLTGLTSEQCLFFCYGLGSNGKSTFLGIVKEMLGAYACSAPRDLLMVQKSPKHETEFARLLGKRLATGAEVGDGQRFDEAKVKDLTGSDVVPARRMNEDFWDLKPSHKLWLAGNYRPTIVGSDLGIWRRIRLIPWLVTIGEGDKDRDLPAKLRLELPGLLRWAVNGCLEWQRIGLAEPISVLEATEAYRLESDVLGSFIGAHLGFDRESTVSKSTLRERYERWCRDAGHEPVGGRRMAARLRELGAVETHIRESGLVRHGWRGVRVLSEAEQFSRAEPASGQPLS
jgi:putative DNA primase/helicase